MLQRTAKQLKLRINKKCFKKEVLTAFLKEVEQTRCLMGRDILYYLDKSNKYYDYLNACFSYAHGSMYFDMKQFGNEIEFTVI